MSDGPYPGNYPPEIWPGIRICIEEKNFSRYHAMISKGLEDIKPPYVLLLDIHNFSCLCSQETKEDLKEFLAAFFQLMCDLIHEHGGNVNKFIGDAALAFFDNKRKQEMKKIGKRLIESYRNYFKSKAPQTDLAVGITKPQRLLKGFVGSSYYIDYSYWGIGLNFLFKAIKDKPEGEVHFFGP